MIEELLEAIYASPDDDAPRLVYADALLERGDPRGEFIVRQCRGDAADDLLAQHKYTWLGELTPFLIASRFERGFLFRASVTSLRRVSEIDPVVGHPLWRTVRELVGPVVLALHPAMAALSYLQAEKTQTHWRELLTGTPRALEELCYQPDEDETFSRDSDSIPPGMTFTTPVSHDEIVALSECAALPKLRRLVLRELPETALPTIFGGSLLDRVPLVETHHGPIRVTIAGGLATITLVPTAPTQPHAVLSLIARLPERLAISLVTGPRFDRSMIERALGRRLR